MLFDGHASFVRTEVNEMSYTKYRFCPMTGSRDFKHYHKRFHESFYLYGVCIVDICLPVLALYGSTRVVTGRRTTTS